MIRASASASVVAAISRSFHVALGVALPRTVGIAAIAVVTRCSPGGFRGESLAVIGAAAAGFAAAVRVDDDLVGRGACAGVAVVMLGASIARISRRVVAIGRVA
jgi:hypothetical protein